MDADVRQALRVLARSGDVGMSHLMEMFSRLCHEKTDITQRFELSLERHKIEHSEEWDKWSCEIPEIEFPAGWKVRIIPPRTMAIVRFVVNGISVYLDCYARLGHMPGPYWEIYPAEDGNTERYAMEDVKGLLDGLKRASER